ncbi:MAG: hypothetical protein V9H69_17890 [Anaerolineae bacterium]
MGDAYDLACHHSDRTSIDGFQRTKAGVGRPGGLHGRAARTAARRRHYASRDALRRALRGDGVEVRPVDTNVQSLRRLGGLGRWLLPLAQIVAVPWRL